MERARVGTVELEYEVRGRGEPMLLIHGAHIAGAMRPLAEEPALDRFQRIAYHRRGYAGSTPAVGPVTIQEHAGDALGLLDHLGVERAHVVGHSSGGMIALALTLREQSRVRSLVLLEPPLLDIPEGEAFTELIGPLVERYAAGDAAGAVDAFLAGVGGDDWRAAIARTVPGGVEQAERQAATFFESELPGAGSWRFGPEDAAALALPVLSVVGRESVPLFVESHARYLEWIDGCREAWIEGVGHLLQVQDPPAVAAAIAAFCGASAASPA